MRSATASRLRCRSVSNERTLHPMQRLCVRFTACATIGLVTRTAAGKGASPRRRSAGATPCTAGCRPSSPGCSASGTRLRAPKCVCLCRALQRRCGAPVPDGARPWRRRGRTSPFRPSPGAGPARGASSQVRSVVERQRDDPSLRPGCGTAYGRTPPAVSGRSSRTGRIRGDYDGGYIHVSSMADSVRPEKSL